MEKDPYAEIPRADPLNPLITHINGRSFPGLGRFELLTHASELGWHITNKIVRKSLLGKIFLNNVENQYFNPRTTPTPNPEFSGNWKLSFSGGYFRIRGTNLSFQFQWDILRRSLGSRVYSLHTHLYTCWVYLSTHTLIKRNTPPGGGSYSLCSLVKNPEEEDPPRIICTRCFEGGPLPLGSWSGNKVNRKPPRGHTREYTNYTHKCTATTQTHVQHSKIRHAAE